MSVIQARDSVPIPIKTYISVIAYTILCRAQTSLFSHDKMKKLVQAVQEVCIQL